MLRKNAPIKMQNQSVDLTNFSIAKDKYGNAMLMGNLNNIPSNIQIK